MRRMEKDKCRFCGFILKKIFIDLGKTPLANSYLKSNQIKKPEKKFPLQVFICKNCFLIQLKEYESPKEIFGEYAYLSSYSKSWLKHAEDYVSMMVSRFNFNKKKLVIEIASNDGYLLQYFQKKKIPILGIEPAKNVAKIARRRGISTISEFFGTKLAKRLINEKKMADLIIGNNVLAHVPNLNDFVEGIKLILKPNGIATIEVPHLLKLIEHNEFDTIYHEHFSYFSLNVLKQIFAHHKLLIFDVEELQTHGGSIRIFIKHKNNKQFFINSKVYSLISREKKYGLCTLDTYTKFDKNIRKIKNDLNKFLKKSKISSKTVVAYGAPAKGNTLLNYCGIKSKHILYTVDKNPYKQNRFLPGSHIPIKHTREIMRTKPDYLLILPWNLRTEIIEQMNFISKWGGQFDVPIPKLQVIN